MMADMAALTEELEQLRRRDARELLRCPYCGGPVSLRRDFENGGPDHVQWLCYYLEKGAVAGCPPSDKGPVLGALLAWHDAAQQDCRTCGLCCLVDNLDASPGGYLVHYERVLTKDDLLRISQRDQWEHIRLWNGELRLLAQTDPVMAGPLHGARVIKCALLRGNVGHHPRCSIYENRPAACREFMRGSAACIKLREQYHLPRLNMCEVFVDNVMGCQR